MRDHVFFFFYFGGRAGGWASNIFPPAGGSKLVRKGKKKTPTVGEGLKDVAGG